MDSEGRLPPPAALLVVELLPRSPLTATRLPVPVFHRPDHGRHRVAQVSPQRVSTSQ
jgi:hypothetical protein